MSPTERMELAAALGMDLGVIQPFDHALSQLSAEEFLHLLVAQLGVAGLVVGPDFALGTQLRGTPARAQRAGRRHGLCRSRWWRP